MLNTTHCFTKLKLVLTNVAMRNPSEPTIFPFSVWWNVYLEWPYLWYPLNTVRNSTNDLDMTLVWLNWHNPLKTLTVIALREEKPKLTNLQCHLKLNRKQLSARSGQSPFGYLSVTRWSQAQHYTYQRDLTGFVLPLRWLRECPKYLSQDHSEPKETVADRFAHHLSFPSNTVASSCLVKELKLGRLGSLKKCH